MISCGDRPGIEILETFNIGCSGIRASYHSISKGVWQIFSTSTNNTFLKCYRSGFIKGSIRVSFVSRDTGNFILQLNCFQCISTGGRNYDVFHPGIVRVNFWFISNSQTENPILIVAAGWFQLPVTHLEDIRLPCPILSNSSIFISFVNCVI